jgi:hypothetical protein
MFEMAEKDWVRFDTKWVPEPNTGCWLWIGHVDKDEYGQLHVRPSPGRNFMYKAHRLA